MLHPDDDRVTLSPKELEAAYRQHWDEYMERVRKIVAEHADDLNATKGKADDGEDAGEQGS